MAVRRVPGNCALCALLFGLSFAVVPSYLPAGAQGVKTANARDSEGNRSAKDFQFDVASIRPIELPGPGGGRGITPDGYRAAINLTDMIKFAYSSEEFDAGRRSDSTNVINLPSWAGWYQIDARVAPSDMPAWQAQGKGQELLRSSLRAILKDRFRLVLHERRRDIPVYNLVVSRKGMRLKPSVPGAVLPVGMKFPDGGVSPLFSRDPSQPAPFYNATIADLLWIMGHEMDRPIQDGTGLTGHYDFIVYRMPREKGDVDMSGLYVLKPLGLELKPGKGTGTDLIIDHIEKLSPN